MYFCHNKYFAKKTVVDGITFDSKWEAERFMQLKLLERAREISDLQRQVRFTLQESFISHGHKIRPIEYVADFMYKQNDKIIVEDTKSPATRTPEYMIKKKLFLYKFPEYEFIESYKH